MSQYYNSQRTKNMNEAETRAEYIDPKLKQVGRRLGANCKNVAIAQI